MGRVGERGGALEELMGSQKGPEGLGLKQISFPYNIIFLSLSVSKCRKFFGFHFQPIGSSLPHRRRDVESDTELILSTQAQETATVSSNSYSETHPFR